MNAIELLSQVKIASPCPARWEDMAGDEQHRFCRQCNRHVYNFSAMSVEAAADLIRAKEGKLCGRFYRRRDGSMLTANCPLGAARGAARLKSLTVAAASLLLTSFGVLAWSNGDFEPRERGPFAEKCDDLLSTLKGWFGLNPKPVITGMLCVPLPPSPSPPAGATGTNVATDAAP